MIEDKVLSELIKAVSPGKVSKFDLEKLANRILLGNIAILLIFSGFFIYFNWQLTQIVLRLGNTLMNCPGIQ